MQNRSPIDMNLIATRLGTTTLAVRESLEGLCDVQLVRRIDDRFVLGLRGRCTHVKLPGENPFAGPGLTPAGGASAVSHSTGGLGGLHELASEDPRAPDRGSKVQYLDTPLQKKIDTTTRHLGRNVRGIRPMSSAWTLIRYFDDLAEHTVSAWKRTDTAHRTWFRREIYRWLTKRDLTPDFVSEMMQIFFKDISAGVVRPGKHELWRVFVTKRNHYHLRVDEARAKIAWEETDDELIDTEAVPRNSILPTRREVEDRERRT